MQKKIFQRMINKFDDPESALLFSPARTTRTKASKGVMRSHDYEAEESPVWRSYETAALVRDRGKFWTSGKKRGLMRWVLTVAIGIVTAFAAMIITYLTGLLITLKFTVSENLLRKGGPWLAFPAFLSFNLLYVYCANFVVRLEPMSAGSGVPEIKTWLNGVAIPRLVRAQTLLHKAIGVTFSVAGGLPCGKEGPMVQIGSGLAAGLAQGKSTTLGFDTSFSKFQDFRNDREKRDFVACGAAAGVAAAFGAPIAGVLFTLEESASFWSTKLTWRTFFCTLVTVYTLYIIKSASSQFGQLDQTFMFNFGEFYELQSDMANYSVWELGLFVAIGTVGGVVGAATVQASKALTLRRLAQSPMEKAVEVHLVCVAMSLLAFFLPLWFGKCTERPDPFDEDAEYTAQEQSLIGELVQFRCPSGHYNELASLWFTAPETTIKQLFHYRAPFHDLTKETFSSATLVLFAVPYQLVFGVMIGCAVPGGVFIPSMIAGAAFGRLVDHAMLALGGGSQGAQVATAVMFADKGTYALVGAAAALSGLTRLTIAATVMLLEATGNMQYVLPLMLSVMSARFSGNLFNDAIQDMQIVVKKLPFLEAEIRRSVFGPDGVELTAGHVMTHCRPPITLSPVMRVKDVVGVLEEHEEFDFFPVTDPEQGNCLVGSIVRNTLCLLLKHRQVTFYSDHPSAVPAAGGGGGGGASSSSSSSSASSSSSSSRSGGCGSVGARSVPALSWEELQRPYPRWPGVGDVECRVNAAEGQAWLDLRPYMNAGPYLVQHTTSLGRTYRLFRTLGLRHLCVVDFANRVVGVVTRKDLTDEALAERCAEVRAMGSSSRAAAPPPPAAGSAGAVGAAPPASKSASASDLLTSSGGGGSVSAGSGAPLARGGQGTSAKQPSYGGI